MTKIERRKTRITKSGRMETESIKIARRRSGRKGRRARTERENITKMESMRS